MISPDRTRRDKILSPVHVFAKDIFTSWRNFRNSIPHSQSHIVIHPGHRTGLSTLGKKISSIPNPSLDPSDEKRFGIKDTKSFKFHMRSYRIRSKPHDICTEFWRVRIEPEWFCIIYTELFFILQIIQSFPRKSFVRVFPVWTTLIFEAAAGLQKGSLLNLFF